MPPMGRCCSIDMPIVKSVADGRGGLIQHGIAASARRDLHGEVINMERAPAHFLPYLQQCGTVDWQHRSDDILGKVQKAALWGGDEIRKSLAGLDVVPPALWVQNSIDPLDPDPTLVSPGQREVYKAHNAGRQLYMSAYGKGFNAGRVVNAAGEEGDQVVPTFFNRIAVTPEPANWDARGSIIAKSLDEFWGELREGDHTSRNGVAREPHELPPLVYVATACYDTELLRSIQKSLDVSGAVPVDGTAGGDSLKPLGVAGNGGEKRCKKCKTGLHPMAHYCHCCGCELVQDDSSPNGGFEIRKSVDQLVSDLREFVARF